MTRFIDEEVSYYDRAVDELKRVDHLIYVSLKYTRTADVLRNTIDRMIECFGNIVEGLLIRAEDRNIIFDIPVAPGAKINEVKRIYDEDKDIKEMIEFYTYLRKIANAEYRGVREFRRHVTMIASLLDGTEEEINIDIITEYYSKCKRLVEDLGRFFKSDEES